MWSESFIVHQSIKTFSATPCSDYYLPLKVNQLVNFQVPICFPCRSVCFEDLLLGSVGYHAIFITVKIRFLLQPSHCEVARYTVIFWLNHATFRVIITCNLHF